MSSLGDLLLRQHIKDFMRRVEPTLRMLNSEWGLMEVPRMGGTVRRFVHYCPTGDIRASKGKGCDLCRVSIPEAVQFLAQVLLPNQL